MSRWLYLALDVSSALVPFLFSFHPKLAFNKQFRFAVPAIALVAVVFVCWDALFTKLGVWGFNNNYVSGFHVGNLPIEEVLFFICIPFACLFTYHCLRILNVYALPERVEKIVTALLILMLLVISVMNLFALYTSVTFILLALVLAVLKYAMRVEWLALFYISFAVLLIPFFIINGALTGTGLPQPVVWYNDNENLGLRMLTIPVEDVFYGMLLQLLNVAIYKMLKRRYASR